MRLSAGEKMEIIEAVTRSELGVKRTLTEFGISRSTFYSWYDRHLKDGYEGLELKNRDCKQQWNSIPEQVKEFVVEVALDKVDLSARELAHHITDEHEIFISESSVYRILKNKGLISAPTHILISASNEFKDKTGFVHEMWQTDFTYFRIKGWGDYYLSTILDDFSRYIVHWELCTSMKHEDVIRNVDMAIEKAKLKTKVKPKLLSDNGSCYISKELGKYLNEELEMKQVHGRPAHPQTQGKIERYHRTMKNVVKLNNYYSPEELKEALEEFVNRYNNERYHESLKNLTPADVYYGRGDLILKQRESLKKLAINNRKTEYLKQKLIDL
jgi:transposase InsO family protein